MNRWLGVIARRETGESLALFRVACGACTFTWLLSTVLHGIVSDIWLPTRYGGYREFDSLPWQFELLGGLTPTTLWFVLGICLTTSVAVVIGFGGRFATILLLQSFLAIARLNWEVAGGDCRLTANCLWLLFLAGGTQTLSLDCRLRTGRWTSDRPAAAWPRYLVFYQLVVVYFTTGLQKLSIDWTPAGGYSALYYILQEPSWQRFDMSWLAWIYPLTQIATALTWLWEVSAPLLILAAWYRATRDRPGLVRRWFNRIGFRRVYVAVGVLMHLGVFLLIDLSLFTFISLAMYTCLFTPTEWRAAWSRLANRFGRQTIRQADDGLPQVGTRALSWKQGLVGAFVAFHLVAISLAALPAPPGSFSRDDLLDEDVQASVIAWNSRLNNLGLNTTVDQLSDLLWQSGSRYMSLRQALLTPLAPYYDLCGTAQGWRMFVGAHRNPTRLRIEVHAAGKWQTVYQQGSREHNWMRTQLNHEHWRTVIFTIAVFGGKERQEQFASWAAREAMVDYPGADALRVRVYKSRSPTPAEVKQGRQPKEAFAWSVEVTMNQDSP